MPKSEKKNRDKQKDSPKIGKNHNLLMYLIYASSPNEAPESAAICKSQTISSKQF